MKYQRIQNMIIRIINEIKDNMHKHWNEFQENSKK
jgi:hypothetical protein